MIAAGQRVRAVGWLSLILLGFSFATFVAQLFRPHEQVFYHLDFPFGPIPALLWTALVIALWMLCRRTPGAPFVLIAAVFWMTAYGLAYVGGEFPGPAPALIWTIAPIMLATAFIRSGFPRVVWITCLTWGMVGLIGLAASNSAALLPYPLFMAVTDVVLAFRRLATPLLEWVFLGVLGVLLLMERGPSAPDARHRESDCTASEVA